MGKFQKRILETFRQKESEKEIVLYFEVIRDVIWALISFSHRNFEVAITHDVDITRSLLCSKNFVDLTS